ncbi:MAG TPA: hypothetical protein VGN09_01235 [Vicinamibacteria bacterium]
MNARDAAGAGVAYLVIAVLWALPMTARPTERVPDLGDPLHLAWTMAWDAHALVHQPLRLYDANAFHPYPRSLAFGDHLLPEAVMVAPIFWATGNAVLASNAAVVLALALSATAMFLLVRHITACPAAAFLAGLVYAFNSLTLHELPRVHVLSVQWWPLALLGLDRFRVGGRRRDALLAAAALALEGLSGTYYLVYTALLAPVWLLAMCLVRPRPAASGMRRLLLALAIAAAVGAALLWPYAMQFRAMGFEKAWTGGADLVSYLKPAPRNLLWPSLDADPGRAELPHFVGLLTLVLATFGLARFLTGRAGRGARAVVACALVAAAIGLVFSLGPIVHVGGRRIGTGPYDLLYRLAPPLRGMAGPERFGVLVPLGLAVLVGIAVGALLTRLPRRARWGVTAALSVLIPLEHWSVPRAAAEVPAGADLPPVYRWLGRDRRTPVVELPLYPQRARKQWAAYLYFSTYHWRPIPVGRTSFYPPAHEFLARMLEGFPDDVSLAAMDRLGIDTVVVHPRLWPEDSRGARLQAVDDHARLRLLQAFTGEPDPRFAALGLGEERVYRLAGAPPPLAPPCAPADPIPRETWTLSSSGVNKEDLVRDGDRATAWHTAQPQRPGDYLEVRLGRVETVAAVGLGLYYPYDELPRNPVVVVEGEGGGRRRMEFADGPSERRAVLDALLEQPRKAEWALRFPPVPARAVRIQVGWREEDPSWPAWSLPELQLYGSCR